MTIIFIHFKFVVFVCLFVFLIAMIVKQFDYFQCSFQERYMRTTSFTDISTGLTKKVRNKKLEIKKNKKIKKNQRFLNHLINIQKQIYLRSTVLETYGSMLALETK